MCFLTYVWSKTHIYEYMIKKAFGLRILQLIPDILKQLLVYESLGFLCMMFFTLFYELFVNNLNNWKENITKGFLMVIFIYSGIAVILTMIPLKWIAKQEPISIITSKE